MGRLAVRSYSFQKRIRLFFYLLYLLLIGILLLYTYYTIHVLRRNAESMQRQSLRLFCAQAQNSMRDPQTYLTNLNSYSLDLSVVAAHSHQEEIYGSIINVNNLLRQSALSFSMVDGLYAYFPKNQVFIGAIGNNYNSSSQFPVWLRSRFREDEAFSDTLQQSGSVWSPVCADGHWYLVLLNTLNNSYVGAFVDTDSLTDRLEESGGAGAIAFFSDQNGQTACVDESGGKEQTAEAAETASGYTEDSRTGGRNVRRGDQILPAQVSLDQTLAHSQTIQVAGTNYLVQSEPTGFSQLYLTVMTPYAQVTGRLLFALRLLLILFFLSIAVFLVAIRWSLQMLSRPLRLLQSTAEAISAGDVHRRVDTVSLHAREFREIADAFNHMLDTIEKMRINAYEQELERRSLELNLLKSQVSPHFFINCLGLIDLMADGTEAHSQVIHKMIARLSRHLRYTLRAKDRVPLSEELEYVDNYIEMTKLRFPGCLTVTYDIDPEAEKAEIFPILLLNFTENAFKHNLVMGEPFSLTIRASVLTRGGEKRLHLTHLDSGQGFDAEFLDQFNRIKSLSAEDQAAQRARIQQEGYHIGNWNLIRHLTLIYGDTADVSLSNEPGSGARIDIDIPYREYRQDADV